MDAKYLKNCVTMVNTLLYLRIFLRVNEMGLFFLNSE